MTKQWQQVNSEQVEMLVNSDKFIHKSKCVCGVPLHTFTHPGEQLEGRLRPCPNHDRADRAKCAHISIPTMSGKEFTIAIRLSKMLWEAIAKETNEKPMLWGQWVRITYRGSVWTKYGHAQKVYSVEYDKGAITEHFIGVETNGSKQSKPRAGRRIRRPKLATG